MDLLDDDRVLDLRPRARRTDAAAVIGEERARRPALPEANAALREWQGDRPEPAPARSAEGLCAVCKARPARALCRDCGQGACGIDTWAMLGLCKACVPAGGR